MTRGDSHQHPGPLQLGDDAADTLRGYAENGGHIIPGQQAHLTGTGAGENGPSSLQDGKAIIGQLQNNCGHGRAVFGAD